MWKKFHRKHASNISNQHLTGLTEVQIYYKLSTILATQLVKGLTTNAPRMGGLGKFSKLSALGAILRVPEQIWGTSEIFSRVIFVRIIHAPPLGAPPPPGVPPPLALPPSRGGGGCHGTLGTPLDPPLIVVIFGVVITGPNKLSNQ